MVAAVAAEDPETAAKIPQLKTLTCNSLPGNPFNNGDNPLNQASDSRLRNRISPIQINRGRAVNDQDVVAPQLEVA